MSIKKIHDIVRKRAKKEDFEHHIMLVRKNALILAKKYNADKEVVELASYLHDIARLGSAKEAEDHHTRGAEVAEKIMKGFGYPQKTINHVKACIISHSSRANIKPKTMEAKIISAADVMSHFDDMPFLLFVAIRYNNNSLEESRQWVREKIMRDWKKPLLPEARKMIKPKYDAIMKILE